jgi:hypothetical protein
MTALVVILWLNLRSNCTVIHSKSSIKLLYFYCNFRDLDMHYECRRFGLLSSRSAKRKYSISNPFDWTVIGTDLKFSTYFILHEQHIHCILNHVDNWTKQWQAGAAQLPLLGAPCFLLDKSDLFVCIFVNKNWPINIHCRTF